MPSSATSVLVASTLGPFSTRRRVDRAPRARVPGGDASQQDVGALVLPGADAAGKRRLPEDARRVEDPQDRVVRRGRRHDRRRLRHQEARAAHAGTKARAHHLGEARRHLVGKRADADGAAEPGALQPREAAKHVLVPRAMERRRRAVEERAQTGAVHAAAARTRRPPSRDRARVPRRPDAYASAAAGHDQCSTSAPVVRQKAGRSSRLAASYDQRFSTSASTVAHRVERSLPDRRAVHDVGELERRAFVDP